MNRIAIFTASALCGLGLVVPALSQEPAKNLTSTNVAVDKSQLPRNTGMISSFAPIVDTIAPSVVSVYTSKTVRVPRAYREYFGVPRSGTVQGLGSGVIVSDDGYILTNNHVADGADEILVSIGLEHKEYKAKKIGADPGTDIAVLKIDGKNLPAITFADSDKARVGDIVLAVGNPYGLTRTVTMGIISGLGRGGMGLAEYENFIQTDASINPGNSGGALVDTEGRLVGINTAIFSPNGGGNNGIGFAVPANLAHEVLKSIREHGSVIRGFLGISIASVTQELADSLKLDEVSGALVSGVTPGGPADKAGMKTGDVVKEISGSKIDDARRLRLLVSGMAPGSKVDVKFLREGKEKTVNAELGTLPSKAELGSISAPSAPPPAQHVSNILDGITVGDLDDDVRETFHIPGKVHGVIISSIETDSAGYKAGLRAGYVIEQVNHQPVHGADEAVVMGDKIKKGEKVDLQIWSKSRSENLTLGGN